MKELKTISVKVNQLNYQEYLSLLSTSSQLFNYYTKWGYENKTYNKNLCHSKTYQDVTKLFPTIKTALVQSIRDNALECVKARRFKSQTILRIGMLRNTIFETELSGVFNANVA